MNTLLILIKKIFKNNKNFKFLLDSHQSTKYCYDTLRKAASVLKVIIETKFDEARCSNDFASMERFLKLFPQINEHTNGLQRFSDYLCSKIKALADENYKVKF